MALLRVKFTENGSYTDMPTPAPENYYVQDTHFEKSYRDDTGYFHRDIIRYNQAKIFCGWDLLSPSEMSLIQSIYTAKEVWVQYTDNSNSRVVKKFYAGPIDSKAKTMDKTTFEILFRTKVNMNLIEY